MTILNEITKYTKERISRAKKELPLGTLKNRALSLTKNNFEFEKVLSKDGLSFICECKKASPSKGIISSDYPYLQIAEEYEQAGADAISVLTEPKWFLGKNDHLETISNFVSVPTLRKDFTVDEYMIYEAKLLGASAVLLICSISDYYELKEYICICDELGISALTEAHDEKEIETALKANARIIGINNRNLKDFSVNADNSRNLGKYIPENILFVSESGVRDINDIRILRDAGADGVLIGEALMRAKNKKETLARFRSVL